ncbi:hypothetical protein J4Q44_G00137370 [Coregonus suidteri]|uniref:Uncharacterized protein n=1 Tax=Coregonus suidteri TaxID=861788 RepID=A0AAN8LPL9_9TELE
MYWLKQGDTSGTAGFESLAAYVLLMVGFVTLVPALCRSFTRSPPCGSGIFAHRSCDHFDPTG